MEIKASTLVNKDATSKFINELQSYESILGLGADGYEFRIVNDLDESHEWMSGAYVYISDPIVRIDTMIGRSYDKVSYESNYMAEFIGCDIERFNYVSRDSGHPILLTLSRCSIKNLFVHMNMLRFINTEDNKIENLWIDTDGEFMSIFSLPEAKRIIIDGPIIYCGELKANDCEKRIILNDLGLKYKPDIKVKYTMYGKSLRVEVNKEKVELPFNGQRIFQTLLRHRIKATASVFEYKYRRKGNRWIYEKI